MEAISHHSNILIGIAIIFGMISLTFLLCWLKVRQVDRFRRTVSEGDPCVFFINEDRVIGVVAVVSAEGIVINSVYGQYIRPVDEIYPI